MRTTMRMGLITGEYPPDQGGVGDFTRQLGRALTNQDHEVHVITSASQPSEVADQRSQVTVHRVVENWGFRCWRQVLSLSRRLNLNVLNVQYQAAAYDMHPGINLVPGRGRRPPVVVTFHDLKVPYLFPKAGPLRWWVVRALARRADAVIVTNLEDELKLSESDSGIRRLQRIPIGSNIEPALPPDFDRTAERARWGVRPDDLLLGYFGFLNESKGGEELIRALGLLVEQGSPAHLLKIGGRAGTSDPTNRAYANRLDRLIAELGLEDQVHRTGYIPSEQVSTSLRAVDVCVLPYRDGVSFRRGSLLACLAHGRAVVTTRPAVPLLEIEDGKNLVLVEPENPSALAHAVTRLAADPERRARLEEGARSLARRFTWQGIAERMAELFAGVATGHQ